jgi:GNAT superfamily N-acetyltransferase
LRGIMTAMLQPAQTCTIIAPRAGMFDAWFVPFARYARLAGTAGDEAQARTLWRWILDGSYRVAAWLACDQAKAVVGFAHYRPYPDVLTGRESCALDALYVDDAYRDAGLEGRLLTAVCEIAAHRGWSEVRWTATDAQIGALVNEPRLQRTSLVTYRIPLG